MSVTEVYLPRNRRPVPTRTRLRTRRISLAGYLAALLLLPALVVVGSMATGWWSTTGRTLAAAGTGSGAGRAASGGTGQASGQAAPAVPADVRGSMTVEQVVAAFPQVTAAQVLAAFGAPADTPASTQLKTLVEAGGGMELPAFRSWLEQRPAP